MAGFSVIMIAGLLFFLMCVVGLIVSIVCAVKASSITARVVCICIAALCGAVVLIAALSIGSIFFVRF